MNISIVIPVYNEEKLAKQAISELFADLKKSKLDFEIILVENGSLDNSPIIVDRFPKIDKRIKVIHLPKADYGNALFQGYISASGDVVTNFSVDWIDLVFLKKALLLIDRYDVIVSSKNIHGSYDDRPFIRRFGGMFFHWLVKIFFAVSVSDTHGIKVLRRKKIENIIKKCCYRGEIFDTELIIRAFKSGLSIKEIPANVQERRSSRVSILNRGFRGFIQLLKLRLVLYLEGIF